MEINISATKNTMCFAIISSIEEDLRAFITYQCHLKKISDILPEDVRKAASKRWETDNSSSASSGPPDDSELLNYSDFMDIKKAIDKSLSSKGSMSDSYLKELASHFETLIPIRNRVCSGATIKLNDLVRCINIAQELLTFKGIEFSSLKRTVQLLDQ